MQKALLAPPSPRNSLKESQAYRWLYLTLQSDDCALERVLLTASAPSSNEVSAALQVEQMQQPQPLHKPQKQQGQQQQHGAASRASSSSGSVLSFSPQRSTRLTSAPGTPAVAAAATQVPLPLWPAAAPVSGAAGLLAGSPLAGAPRLGLCTYHVVLQLKDRKASSGKHAAQALQLAGLASGPQV